MKFLLFLGSVRESAPPKPMRLGKRVSKAIVTNFEQAFPEHEIEVIDALDIELNSVFKPEFAFSSKDKPDNLKMLAKKISQADGYLMVSPEYNHSMSPALANLLNHFGSSLFSYKPSSIVTYSAGQWGGARAAVSMRTFLSELGCLPVSAMIHIPKAQEVFDESGEQEKEEKNNWASYFNRTFSQLVWWAEACSSQKQKTDPRKQIKDFKQAPSERNAP